MRSFATQRTRQTRLPKVKTTSSPVTTPGFLRTMLEIVREIPKYIRTPHRGPWVDDIKNYPKLEKYEFGDATTNWRKVDPS